MLADMKTYPFSLGHMHCASLYDNSTVSDLKEIFPHFTSAVDQPEKVQVGFNCLYLKQENHILIDTGTGQGQLVSSLASLGVKPEDIDIVILTHGDRDHIGGVLNFPRAQFFMSRHMFDSWNNSQEQEFMMNQFAKLFNHLDEYSLRARVLPRIKFATEVFPQIKSRTTAVEYETEFLPGIKFIDARGHRSDHTALEIQSGQETLIHLADSMRHPLQINHDLASSIDSFPEEVIATNKRLLERALDKNALLFGAHLSFPGLARVQKSSETLMWQWVR